MVAALVDAAPGVNSPAAQRQLLRCRTGAGMGAGAGAGRWGSWLGGRWGGGSGGEAVKASMTTFVCYAAGSGLNRMHHYFRTARADHVSLSNFAVNPYL